MTEVEALRLVEQAAKRVKLAHYGSGLRSPLPEASSFQLVAKIIGDLQRDYTHYKLVEAFAIHCELPVSAVTKITQSQTAN